MAGVTANHRGATLIRRDIAEPVAQALQAGNYPPSDRAR
jgi:hypothetical protein